MKESPELARTQPSFSAIEPRLYPSESASVSSGWGLLRLFLREHGFGRNTPLISMANADSCSEQAWWCSQGVQGHGPFFPRYPLPLPILKQQSAYHLPLCC